MLVFPLPIILFFDARCSGWESKSKRLPGAVLKAAYAGDPDAVKLLSIALKRDPQVIYTTDDNMNILR
jgi:hypothetical protein